MSAFGWKLKGDGKTIPPGQVVAPGERLNWPRTIGLGAQHVFAMFGATFVFPIIMGLNPQYAVMMSGFATIFFLLVVNGRIPSYLGTSGSFVGGVAAIRLNQGGDSAEVTGGVLVAGVVLAIIGVIIHYAGGHVIAKVIPPAVSGAVVMLIGFNLAPVVAQNYWPFDQWTAILTMAFVVVVAVAAKGFISRIGILLGLIFGVLISWLFDNVFGKIATPDGKSMHFRLDMSSVGDAKWFGFPTNIMQPDGTELTGPHLPTFTVAAILVILPSVIALLAENTGHVRAVSEMTGEDLDPYLGRGFIGDGVATAVAGFIGASPTTTYAENIGVMAATKVYSTAAYYVAAIVAIVFGFSPKFGAAVSSVPQGVLGGITVILYGMIGLLGAKIWVENRIDFGAPQNLVPLSAALIIAIGNVQIVFSDSFSLGGIALGTIVVLVLYHAARWMAPHLRREEAAAGRAYAGGAGITVGDVYDESGKEVPSHRADEDDSSNPKLK